MAFKRFGRGAELARYIWRQRQPQDHLLATPLSPACSRYAINPSIARLGSWRFLSANIPDQDRRPPAAPKQDDRQEKSKSAPDQLSVAAKLWMQVKLKELRQGLREAPPVALSLGLSGAIPFVALAPPLVYVLPLPDFYTSYVDAQAAYGALILSFLGGPHWGLAMVDKTNDDPALTSRLSGFTTTSTRYIWSVTPCLLGWLALLLPSVTKLEVLLGSFGLAVAVDYTMAKLKLLPGWYLPLRILLTAIAMLSLGSTLLVEAAKETLEVAKEKIEEAGSSSTRLT